MRIAISKIDTRITHLDTELTLITHEDKVWFQESDRAYSIYNKHLDIIYTIKYVNLLKLVCPKQWIEYIDSMACVAS